MTRSNQKENKMSIVKVTEETQKTWVISNHIKIVANKSGVHMGIGETSTPIGVGTANIGLIKSILDKALEHHKNQDV